MVNYNTDNDRLVAAMKLDLQYAQSENTDLKYQVDYLTRVLRDLYDNVQSDVLEDTWSKHLNSSMNDAAEALGLVE